MCALPYEQKHKLAFESNCSLKVGSLALIARTALWLAHKRLEKAGHLLSYSWGTAPYLKNIGLIKVFAPKKESFSYAHF